MVIRSRRSALLLLAAALAAGGCSEGSSAAGAGAGGANTAVATTSSDGQMRVDMDAIFPAGEGRDLLLNNCQSCHTWAPIVVLQMTPEEWDRWAVEHRPRVSNLTEEEFTTLKAYLVENFNPSRPVPELPPALLEGWTTY
jgi:mono/diheme cytochrome c family protein